MPIRGWDTGFWTDPFIQSVPKDGKLLFFYLGTNNHCNQAGLYYITTKTIAFDTGIAEKEVGDLLASLSPKVEWYEDLDLVWVRNFAKRQSNSSKFLVAIAKCLDTIHEPKIIQEFLDYNLKRYGLSIPYTPDITEPFRKVQAREIAPDTDIKLVLMIECYEKKTGRVLTPMHLERLKDAVDNYPQENIEQAIDEAVTRNARSPMSYIESILAREARENLEPESIQADETGKKDGVETVGEGD